MNDDYKIDDAALGTLIRKLIDTSDTSVLHELAHHAHEVVYRLLRRVGLEMKEPLIMVGQVQAVIEAIINFSQKYIAEDGE